MRVCIEVSEAELEEVKGYFQVRALMISAGMDRPGEWVLARLVDAARQKEEEGE